MPWCNIASDSGREQDGQGRGYGDSGPHERGLEKYAATHEDTPGGMNRKIAYRHPIRNLFVQACQADRNMIPQTINGR